MRRLNSEVIRCDRSRERGATALVVAVSALVLFGFVALAVDAGRLYWEKGQLQNGADLAALSIAQACSKDAASPPCTGAGATGQDLADRSANDATSLSNVSLDLGARSVAVDTAAKESGATSGSISLSFARVFGMNEAAVRAHAVAKWGAPSSATSRLPLAFSFCEVDSSPAADGVLQYLLAHGSNTPDQQTEPCTNPSGQEIPGGFGWLPPDQPDSCSADTSIGTWEDREPGNNFPASCTSVLASWKQTLENGGTVVALFPVFDLVSSTPAPQYHIWAYAAIEVHGWHFQNNDATLDYLPPDAAAVFQNYQNSDLGIVGRFIRYSFSDEDASGSGGNSQYGTSVVWLDE